VLFTNPHPQGLGHGTPKAGVKKILFSHMPTEVGRRMTSA
jgi:hypothetical protein